MWNPIISADANKPERVQQFSVLCFIRFFFHA
jgi:hypothetical protein